MQLSATVWEDADLPMVTTQWRNGGIDGERNPQILIPFELLDPVVPEAILPSGLGSYVSQ